MEFREPVGATDCHLPTLSEENHADDEGPEGAAHDAKRDPDNDHEFRFDPLAHRGGPLAQSKESPKEKSA